MTAETARPTPVHPADRIGVLDVLRGIALAGMYVVHFNRYEATPAGTEPGPAAAALERVILLFFEDRFYAMFGILFGVGFALQLARADARGDRFAVRFSRRLAALAAFGFIAEGIFGYNVLFGYAIWGFPLLLVRRWSVSALVVLLMLCAASGPLSTLAQIAYHDAEPHGLVELEDRMNADLERFIRAREAHESSETSPDWGTVVAGRVNYMPAFHRQWSLLPRGSFTLFLIGLVAFRLQLFDRADQHRRLIASLMVAGVASWGVALWVLPIGGPPEAPSAPAGVIESAALMARTNAFQLVRDQWLAFAYVGAVLLLVSRSSAWLERLAPFAWTGRMALSNYMMHVILLDVLFTPHGVGLKVPAILVPVGAIALFAMQAALSQWWLSRFSSGPLEWVWRSVTYWTVQPLRNATPARETGVAL